ncbi:hypothetical protein HDU81_011364 [Chytriomyces hyalinus]|nr:hypothetical protein HDU81_011364 [Chytriomyces hyalinus]
MLGQYQLIRTIGEGEFGKVKLAVSAAGKEVAIKLCKKSQVVATPNGYTKLMREISTLKMVKNHPYIITMIEVIETDMYIAIVMELAKGGELFEHILTSRCLTEEESRKMFAQVICAVGFIHSIGIVHRDLKLENILLDEERNVLVTDFGFANKSLGEEGLLRTSCGSPCYAAPELVTSDLGYVGEAADIWSCGVILFSMIAGYLPYDDDPDNPDGDNINLLYNYIMETKLEFPEYVPPDCQDLISRILVPNPQHRADINEIMNHVWLEPVRFIFESEMEQRRITGTMKPTGPGFSSPAQQKGYLSPSPTAASETGSTLSRQLPPPSTPQPIFSPPKVTDAMEEISNYEPQQKDQEMTDVAPIGPPPPTPSMSTKPDSSKRIVPAEPPVLSPVKSKPVYEADMELDEIAEYVPEPMHVNEHVPVISVQLDHLQPKFSEPDEVADSALRNREIVVSEVTMAVDDFVQTGANGGAPKIEPDSLKVEIAAVEDRLKANSLSPVSHDHTERKRTSELKIVTPVSATTESPSAPSSSPAKTTATHQKRMSVAETVLSFERVASQASTSNSVQKKVVTGAPSSYVAGTAAALTAAAATIAATTAVARPKDHSSNTLEDKPLPATTFASRFLPEAYMPSPVVENEPDAPAVPLKSQPLPVIPQKTSPLIESKQITYSPTNAMDVDDDETPLSNVAQPVTPSNFVPTFTSPPNVPALDQASNNSSSASSSSSSSSTVQIPERLDSIEIPTQHGQPVEEGFLYMDGKFLHVTNNGVVEILDKALPTTPAGSSIFMGTGEKPGSRTGALSSLANYMQTAKFGTASLDRYPPKHSASVDSGFKPKKHVSIREPVPSQASFDFPPPQQAPVLAERSNTSGWKLPSWFKNEGSNARSLERSVSREGVQPSRSESIMKMFRTKEPQQPQTNMQAPPNGSYQQNYERSTSQTPNPQFLNDARPISVLGVTRPTSSLNISGDAQTDYLRTRAMSSTPQPPNRSETPKMKRDYSLRQENSATQLQLHTSSYHDMRPGTPSPLAIEMARSTTVMSLSASDYHVQFASSPRSDSANSRPARKMRSHSGTADHRAISRRDPESLLADLELLFEERGFTVASTGEELGEFRLKIVKPGYLVAGISQSEHPPGVPVPVEDVSKHVRILEDFANSREQKVMLLSPDASRNISRNVKSKQSSGVGKLLSGMPSTILKKLQYVKDYGLRYNSGYAAKSGAGPIVKPDASAEPSLFFVDEVVFYVELQKVPSLPGVCVVDFKRIRGNIWLFKKLYNSLVDELPLPLMVPSASAPVPAAAPDQRIRYAMFGGTYMLMKTIGQGEFGKVKIAVNVKTSKQVAVKLTKKALLVPDRKERLMREISILQSLDHPYILKMHEVIETDSYIGMIMEPCLGGELFEYIVRHDYLQEDEARRFFAQILTGVSYLHSIGIVHRDLKLENILLDSNESPTPNVVIADFGFASQSIRNDSNLLDTSCGSPAYAAPELVLKDKYIGVSADIWSCGVILYAMLCGYLPFDDDPTNPDGANIHLLYKYIMSAKPDYPERLSAGSIELIGIMLITNPEERATMADIMGHSWLAPAMSIFEEELVRRKKLLGLDDGGEPGSPTETVQSIPSSVAPTPPQSPQQLQKQLAETQSAEATSAVVPGFPLAPNPTPGRLQVISKSDIMAKSASSPPPPSPPALLPTPTVSNNNKRVDWAAQESEGSVEPTTDVNDGADANDGSDILHLIPERKDSASPIPDDVTVTSPTPTTAASSTAAIPSALKTSPIDISKTRSSKSKLRPYFRGATPVASTNGPENVDQTTTTASQQMARTPSTFTSATRPSMGGISISASDYHLRYSQKGSAPVAKRLKFHTGPIDKRALSARDPMALLDDLEMALIDAGLEVEATQGAALGEFRLVVKQPGVILKKKQVSGGDVDGEGKKRGPGRRTNGVPVDLQTVVKNGHATKEDIAALEEKLQDVQSVVLEPALAKAIHLCVKDKGGKVPGASGFPVWIAKRFQYLTTFGINYNRGFDGQSLKSAEKLAAGKTDPGVIDADNGVKEILYFVDEITFNVEIFKLKNLDAMYLVNFKRIRGDIWEFKSLYNRIIETLPLEKEY